MNALTYIGHQLVLETNGHRLNLKGYESLVDYINRTGITIQNLNLLPPYWRNRLKPPVQLVTVKNCLVSSSVTVSDKIIEPILHEAHIAQLTTLS